VIGLGLGNGPRHSGAIYGHWQPDAAKRRIMSTARIGLSHQLGKHNEMRCGREKMRFRQRWWARHLLKITNNHLKLLHIIHLLADGTPMDTPITT